MSSSEFKKYTNISSFDFKINDIILTSTKMFKDLKIFVAKSFEWNHQINYLYRIAAMQLHLFKI